MNAREAESELTRSMQNYERERASGDDAWSRLWLLFAMNDLELLRLAQSREARR
jgi:hypothetical protein